MYYMIIAVVDEIERCTPILDEWEAVGVRGITILESTGLGRVRSKGGARDDLPLMPSLRNLLQTREEHHRTLFSVVDGEEMIEKVIAATEGVLGNLNEPHKGIIFAVPVTHVHGVDNLMRDYED